MDRVQASEAWDAGSIPAGGTTTYSVLKQLILVTFFIDYSFLQKTTVSSTAVWRWKFRKLSLTSTASEHM